LTNVDDEEEHSFLTTKEAASNVDTFGFEEGGWNEYLAHEKREAKIRENQIATHGTVWSNI
jgi:hypothetical protein